MKRFRKYIAGLLVLLILAGGICAWVLYQPFRPVNPKSVAHLKVTVHPLGLEQGRDYAYSMALVGDTQVMNWKYPSHYLQMYDWVVANRDELNIQYLIGLGDMADRYVEFRSKGSYHQDAAGKERTFPDEWRSAAIALRKLNGVVPYAINCGNHDNSFSYYQKKETEEYNYRIFGDDYFNLAFNSKPSKLNPYAFRYMDYTVPGGVEGTDYGFMDPDYADTTWRRITIGSQRYLILTLTYGTEYNEAILNWADEIIKANPGDRVILTTHGYLDGEKNHSEVLFGRLVYPNANVCMAVGGHFNGDDIVYQFTPNVSGTPVLEMMINPHGLGDEGLIAILYFAEDGRFVGVEYYSTVSGTPFRDVNQILF